MKKIPFLLVFLALGLVLFTTSCDNDDDCTAPALEENIVGTWSIPLSGDGTIEFQADGTLLDPDDLLYGVEVNGIVYSQKSYSISGTTLSVTAEAPGGAGSSSADFEVVSNECDVITISILTLDVDMNRQ
ncbi:MAG: hypothetical protein AAF798_16230 [Bacteroidota bacterium]